MTVFVNVGEDEDCIKGQERCSRVVTAEHK